MSNIKIFEKKQVRSKWVENQQQWYFSIIDVVAVLSDSSNPRRYWSDLKSQLAEKEGFFELYAKIVQFKMTAPDGKERETDCASTETLLRIIQSIPSPKAEPFKRWLAQVGTERLAEIENPELTAQRMRDLYKAKGSTDNLRDHMTDLELIFTMLGEASTTEIARNQNTLGFAENKRAAKAGGLVAGKARKDLEKKSGRKVVTKENYKHLVESKKRKAIKEK